MRVGCYHAVDKGASAEVVWPDYVGLNLRADYEFDVFGDASIEQDSLLWNGRIEKLARIANAIRAFLVKGFLVDLRTPPIPRRDHRSAQAQFELVLTRYKLDCSTRQESAEVVRRRVVLGRNADNRQVSVVPHATPAELKNRFAVARVSLQRDGVFVLASDAAPLQINIDEGVAPKNTWDLDLAAKALAELKSFRDRGDTVISGHDDGQWQDLRKGLEYYE